MTSCPDSSRDRIGAFADFAPEVKPKGYKIEHPALIAGLSLIS